MKLTQKETDLMKDLKKQEQLCIDKYTNSAEAASDEQLKKLFKKIASVEQKHLKTLEQIEKGTCPKLAGSKAQQPTFNATYSSKQSEKKQGDCFLCNDLLTMEKHASHLYDTCVFEFVSDPVRNVLNLIQKQEQEHGKMIYDYMKANSMAA